MRDPKQRLFKSIKDWKCGEIDALLLVLERFGEEEKKRETDKRHEGTFSSNQLHYSELYTFLGALLRGSPIPPLSETASGAILDLLTCLVRILKQIQESVRSPSSETSLSDKSQQSNTSIDSPNSQWQSVSGKIIDSIGSYLAFAASIESTIHHRTRNGMRTSISELVHRHPQAPMFIAAALLSEDTDEDHTGPVTLKANENFQKLISDRFKDVWKLPQLSEKLTKQISDSKLSDASHSTNHPELVKRMCSFALNPFSLPLPAMQEMERVIRHACQTTPTTAASDHHPLLMQTDDGEREGGGLEAPPKPHREGKGVKRKKTKEPKPPPTFRMDPGKLPDRISRHSDFVKRVNDFPPNQDAQAAQQDIEKRIKLSYKISIGGGNKIGSKITQRQNYQQVTGSSISKPS